MSMLVITKYFEQCVISSTMQVIRYLCTIQSANTMVVICLDNIRIAYDFTTIILFLIHVAVFAN